MLFDANDYDGIILLNNCPLFPKISWCIYRRPYFVRFQFRIIYLTSFQSTKCSSLGTKTLIASIKVCFLINALSLFFCNKNKINLNAKGYFNEIRRSVNLHFFIDSRHQLWIYTKINLKKKTTNSNQFSSAFIFRQN